MFGVGQNPIYMKRLRQRERRREASGEAAREAADREAQRRMDVLYGARSEGGGKADVAEWVDNAPVLDAIFGEYRRAPPSPRPAAALGPSTGRQWPRPTSCVPPDALALSPRATPARPPHPPATPLRPATPRPARSALSFDAELTFSADAAGAKGASLVSEVERQTMARLREELDSDEVGGLDPYGEAAASRHATAVVRLRGGAMPAVRARGPRARPVAAVHARSPCPLAVDDSRTVRSQRSSVSRRTRAFRRSSEPSAGWR